MEYKAPKAEDIDYTYDARGYMMYYKNQPIGGGGLLKNAKGRRGNVRIFKNYAEVTKQQLVAGIGSQYMMERIKAIDEAERSSM